MGSIRAGACCSFAKCPVRPRLAEDRSSAVDVGAADGSAGHSSLPEHLIALGGQHAQAGRLREAEACFRTVLNAQPENAFLMSALGRVVQMQGRFEDAEACFQSALRIQPADPWTHFNRGRLLLLQGRFDACWSELEWFWRSSHGQAVEARELGPRWDGRPLAGRTVLLHVPYGGYGDYLMWVRYAPRLAATGARVVIQCPSTLHRLFGQFPEIDRLVASDAPLPPFHAHAPFITLPHHLNLPHPSQASAPYLQAPPADAARWALSLPREPALRTGVVWAVDPNHPGAPGRSIPLASLAPALRLPGIRPVSLQRDAGLAELRDSPLKDAILNLGPRLTDFADTAGLLAQLDLVITVDTAVAHLAGAMGRPVWLLLSRLPDARWQATGEGCAWYPSARVFRQQADGDWAPVAAQVAHELARLARVGAPPR